MLERLKKIKTDVFKKFLQDLDAADGTVDGQASLTDGKAVAVYQKYIKENDQKAEGVGKSVKKLKNKIGEEAYAKEQADSEKMLDILRATKDAALDVRDERAMIDHAYGKLVDKMYVKEKLNVGALIDMLDTITFNGGAVEVADPKYNFQIKNLINGLPVTPMATPEAVQSQVKEVKVGRNF